MKEKMIGFDEAIKVAKESAESLVKNAKNMVLEGVVISADNKFYEVLLSYDLTGKNPLAFEDGLTDRTPTSLIKLAAIMSYRREYKIFLIDRKTGDFRGFKNAPDRQ